MKGQALLLELGEGHSDAGGACVGGQAAGVVEQRLPGAHLHQERREPGEVRVQTARRWRRTGIGAGEGDASHHP